MINHTFTLGKTAKHKRQMFFFIAFCVLLILSFFSPKLQAQNLSEKLTEQYQTYQEQHFTEKLFLHTDRDYYIAGEIVWFSAYATTAKNTYTDLSSVVYIELINEEKQVVLQQKIGLKNGQGDGSFYVPVSLATGNYTLRAYTRWMRNASPDFFFQKSITVVNTFVSKTSSIETNSNYDIQFLPEGGNLLAEYDNRIAFKAINNNGKGVNIKGVLVNASGDTLLQFKDQHKGMGSFNFSPKPDSVYTAKILIDEKLIEKQLPQAAKEGYALKITVNNNEVEIKSLSTYNEPYFTFFVHNNGNVVKSASVDTRSNQAAITLDLASLETGIHHVTLFNSRGKPVAERLFFNYPKEETIIKTKFQKGEAETRQKLNISVANLTKDAARLSMSVVLLDSLQHKDQVDIRSWLWLLSDLKGYVEAPQYYFTAPEINAKQAMDLLMLTHGWRRFDWNEVTTPKPLKNLLLPELEGPIFEATVLDKETGKPGNWIDSYLSFPGKDFKFYAQKSLNGKLTFILRNVEGPQNAILRAFSESDSTWSFNIVDPFEKKISAVDYPRIILEESLENALEARSIGMQAQNIYVDEKLHQFSKRVADTVPFYGTPDQFYLLDDYTRFPTMEEVMREYVPKVAVRKNKGKYRFKVFNQPDEIFFDFEPLVLLDGMPILNTNEVMRFDPFKIKSLDVLSRSFIVNKTNFTGIVSYRTYDGNYTWQKPDKEDFVFDYQGLQEKRIFYQPAFENPAVVSSKLPDFRTVLYWNPSLNLTANGETDISFFTSDKKGTFKGIVQGLNQQGMPIYHTFEFEVSQVSN